MAHARRVVITGMGVVSPNGVGTPAFSQAVLEGKSGVRRISRFDPSEIPVQIARGLGEFVYELILVLFVTRQTKTC